MSSRHWRFTLPAYGVLLSAMGCQRLPHPFSGLSDDEDYSAEDRLPQRTAAEVQRIFTAELHQAVGVLLGPQIRVDVEGIHGHEDRPIRLQAGILADTATLASQLPGPTRAQGGDVIITQHTAAELAAEITARLPCVAAGSTRPFRGDRGDLTAGYTTDTPVDPKTAFFARPRYGSGEVTVYRDTAEGLVETDSLLWLDFHDDGRYLLIHQDESRFGVVPGSPDMVQKQLHRRLGLARETDSTGMGCRADRMGISRTRNRFGGV